MGTGTSVDHASGGGLASLTTMVKECLGSSLLIIPPWLEYIINKSGEVLGDLATQLTSPANQERSAVLGVNDPQHRRRPAGRVG